MLSAEDFIKQHQQSKGWKQSKTAGGKLKTNALPIREAPEIYWLIFYRSISELSRDLGISRQTVSKKVWSIWVHQVMVHGVKYYVKDADIIEFAFYLLKNKSWRVWNNF